MSFLEQYDAIPAQDVPTRAGFVYQTLSTGWRELFAELRSKRPVFATPTFVMVTRHADVLDILGQPELFSVRGYAGKMDPSVGPFMLARDKTRINWHDKAVMRSVLRWEDLPRVRAIAGEAARESIDAAGDEIDLVPAVGRITPLRIVQRYFGFKGPDDATMLRWSLATQTDMFRNPFNTPEVHEASVKAGTEMRAWLRNALHRPAPPAPAPRETGLARLLRMLSGKPGPAAPAPDTGPAGDDAFSRLQRMMRTPDAPFDEEALVGNMAGLLVGAIETSSQAIVQAAEQILLRPDVRAQAEAAAKSGDNAAFDAIVWEALRFNPITPMVFRFTERDTVLAAGSPNEMAIKAGTVVAPCIASAMFDESVVDDPDSFRPGRPDAAFFHLGVGHHECVGRQVGLQLVPEAVRQILLTPGLRLIEGPAGKIDWAGTVYPEHFRVTRAAPAAQPAQPVPA
jgi:cytochrome P450